MTNLKYWLLSEYTSIIWTMWSSTEKKYSRFIQIVLHPGRPNKFMMEYCVLKYGWKNWRVRTINKNFGLVRQLYRRDVAELTRCALQGRQNVQWLIKTMES